MCFCKHKKLIKDSGEMVCCPGICLSSYSNEEGQQQTSISELDHHHSKKMEIFSKNSKFVFCIPKPVFCLFQVQEEGRIGLPFSKIKIAHKQMLNNPLKQMKKSITFLFIAIIFFVGQWQIYGMKLDQDHDVDDDGSNQEK